MFAYLSALVELEKFDKIYINFLIVGHTHSNDDQYFSVLSKVIARARFVGSPISLDELLRTAHADPDDRPYLVRRIHVIYDVAKAFTPFINRNIHYFQV